MVNDPINYNFEWDPHKAKENLRKHKVGFERAVDVFRDPIAISIFDDEHSQEEERWITLGQDKNGILLVVIHTYEEADNNQIVIRIISARKANRKEIKQYRGSL